MPQILKYVAQLAMDDFYQNYKGESDFWDIEDFIFRTGNTVSSMYLTYYQQEYASLRQEKKDEVVTFDTGWLAEQEADVKKDKDTGNLFAILERPVMTFPYDKSSVGLQNIFPIDPFSNDELERASQATLWQLKYMPKTNRIFFYSDVSSVDGCAVISKLGFVNRGTCNIKKIKVLYVPSMDENSMIPDGLIADAIAKTVTTMKQQAAGVIVDKTLDENPNKVIQTESNNAALIK